MYTGAAKIVRQKLSTSAHKLNEKSKKGERKVTVVNRAREEGQLRSKHGKSIS
jgi:hypothetical protein